MTSVHFKQCSGLDSILSTQSNDLNVLRSVVSCYHHLSISTFTFCSAVSKWFHYFKINSIRWIHPSVGTFVYSSSQKQCVCSEIRFLLGLPVHIYLPSVVLNKTRMDESPTVSCWRTNTADILTWRWINRDNSDCHWGGKRSSENKRSLCLGTAEQNSLLLSLCWGDTTEYEGVCVYTSETGTTQGTKKKEKKCVKILRAHQRRLAGYKQNSELCEIEQRENRKRIKGIYEGLELYFDGQGCKDRLGPKGAHAHKIARIVVQTTKGQGRQTGWKKCVIMWRLWPSFIEFLCSGRCGFIPSCSTGFKRPRTDTQSNLRIARFKYWIF